jgi:hypothetical protein
LFAVAAIAIATVESRAPDQAARNEADKLHKSDKWLRRSRSAGGGLVREKAKSWEAVSEGRGD